MQVVMFFYHRVEKGVKQKFNRVFYIANKKKLSETL
jgi:hypothetical protein